MHDWNESKSEKGRTLLKTMSSAPKAKQQIFFQNDIVKMARDYSQDNFTKVLNSGSLPFFHMHVRPGLNRQPGPVQNMCVCVRVYMNYGNSIDWFSPFSNP